MSFYKNKQNHKIAYKSLKGRRLGIIFIHGLNSDMNGGKALAVEQYAKKNKLNLAFLHCVSSYPTKFNESNIFSIKYLKEKVSKKTIIGYSDHTEGIETSLLAVSLGAKIIEKHFTFDKNFSSFRDHALSSDPKEMKNLVEKIRQLERMMKNNKKTLQFSEIATLKLNRRSCAVSTNLKAGEKIYEKDIIGVRPMLGIPINNKKIFVN